MKAIEIVDQLLEDASDPTRASYVLMPYRIKSIVTGINQNLFKLYELGSRAFPDRAVYAHKGGYRRDLSYEHGQRFWEIMKKIGPLVKDLEKMYAANESREILDSLLDESIQKITLALTVKIEPDYKFIDFEVMVDGKDFAREESEDWELSDFPSTFNKLVKRITEKNPVYGKAFQEEVDPKDIEQFVQELRHNAVTTGENVEYQPLAIIDIEVKAENRGAVPIGEKPSGRIIDIPPVSDLAIR